MPVRVLCWTLNAVFLKPGWASINRWNSIDEMLTLSNDPMRNPKRNRSARSVFRT